MHCQLLPLVQVRCSMDGWVYGGMGGNPWSIYSVMGPRRPCHESGAGRVDTLAVWNVFTITWTVCLRHVHRLFSDGWQCRVVDSAMGSEALCVRVHVAVCTLERTSRLVHLGIWRSPCEDRRGKRDQTISLGRLDISRVASKAVVPVPLTKPRCCHRASKA